MESNIYLKKKKKGPVKGQHKTTDRSTELQIMHPGPSPAQTGDKGFWYGNQTFECDKQINTAISNHISAPVKWQAFNSSASSV